MTEPGRTISRQTWAWFLTVPTLLAVVVLLVDHTVSADWLAAFRTALVVWAIAFAVGAALIRRRQDRR